jgi:hypothetical protein
MGSSCSCCTYKASTDHCNPPVCFAGSFTFLRGGAVKDLQLLEQRRHGAPFLLENANGKHQLAVINSRLVVSNSATAHQCGFSIMLYPSVRLVSSFASSEQCLAVGGTCSLATASVELTSHAFDIGWVSGAKFAGIFSKAAWTGAAGLSVISSSIAVGVLCAGGLGIAYRTASAFNTRHFNGDYSSVSINGYDGDGDGGGDSFNHSPSAANPLFFGREPRQPLFGSPTMKPRTKSRTKFPLAVALGQQGQASTRRLQRRHTWLVTAAAALDYDYEARVKTSPRGKGQAAPPTADGARVPLPGATSETSTSPRRRLVL